MYTNCARDCDLHFKHKSHFLVNESEKVGRFKSGQNGQEKKVKTLTIPGRHGVAKTMGKKSKLATERKVNRVIFLITL